MTEPGSPSGPAWRALARERIRQSADASRRVFRHADLRNVEVSLLLNWTAEHAYLVALGVYAYNNGGALAVGLVGLGRLLPAGIVALVASSAADRSHREVLLRALYLVRASAALASAAAYFAGAPPLIVYLFGGSVTVLSAALRPAYWALLPALARTPEELTASNVLAATSEGMALLAGPALGGLILAATAPGHVFAFAAVLFEASTLMALRISSGGRRPPPKQRPRLIAETIAGVRAVVTHRDTRLLIAVGGAQTFVRGALMVLIVVAALDMLGLGEAGVGFLSSAFGIGNLVGAILALSFVGRRRLGGVLVLGLMLWGVPIALVAVWPVPATALALLLLPGWGNAIFDIAILTMLQRSTPDQVLGRVFGILETVVFASMAAGSIAASGLVALFGVRGAFVAVGMILPVVSLLVLGSMRRIDDSSDVPEDELRLLRQIPMFSTLPAVALEHVAAASDTIEVAPGTVVFAQGDAGDRFYVVESGRVEVRMDGETLAVLGRGEFFGEIALLRGVPRTATVVVAEPVRLLSLGRADFLAAVSRYEQCAHIAEDEIDRRVADAGAHGHTVSSRKS